jgi:hypothetical protein
MIQQNLATLLNKKRCTLLGVGPMSKICVDVAIKLANQHEIPLMLIASRRQIDSDIFGGGYVNNWTTQVFSNYVSEQDLKGKILLARDHGGPWQNPAEVTSRLSLPKALESAKASYTEDIKCGFKVLHIDPSVDIHGMPDVDETLSRVYELYEHCWVEAQKLNKEVIFEIGTEEQSVGTGSQEVLDYILNKIFKFCNSMGIPTPTFVVIQTGTRVMEMRNVGSFDLPVRIPGELPAEIQVPQMIEVCNKYGVMMKEHNADYISDSSLMWHPRLGIHAANVAPEFGVAETKELIGVLKNHGLNDYADKFMQIAYESQKWLKWMLPNSEASDQDRAVIAGHYVFSDARVVELKAKASKQLQLKGIDLNSRLESAVSNAISRYLRCFRLVQE